MPLLPFETYLPSPYCANNGTLNCQDPYSILIHVILYLGQQNPTISAFTVEYIHNNIGVLCPTVSWTLENTTYWVKNAYKRGLITTVGSSLLYAVNSRMALVNPINMKYFCISQLFKSAA